MFTVTPDRLLHDLPLHLTHMFPDCLVVPVRYVVAHSLSILFVPFTFHYPRVVTFYVTFYVYLRFHVPVVLRSWTLPILRVPVSCPF